MLQCHTYAAAAAVPVLCAQLARNNMFSAGTKTRGRPVTVICQSSGSALTSGCCMRSPSPEVPSPGRERASFTAGCPAKRGQTAVLLFVTSEAVHASALSTNSDSCSQLVSEVLWSGKQSLPQQLGLNRLQHGMAAVDLRGFFFWSTDA